MKKYHTDDGNTVSVSKENISAGYCWSWCGPTAAGRKTKC